MEVEAQIKTESTMIYYVDNDIKLNKIVSSDGKTKKFFNEYGNLHGQPAITLNGIKKYYMNGKLHRINGVAIEYPDDRPGEWFFLGLRHRENGVAFIDRSGTEYYYFLGKLHNPNGPAITLYDGSIFYYIHGVQHRGNGKAAVILANGRVEYIVDGEFHRIDGPAYIDEMGFNRYYINGVHYLKEEFLEITKGIK